VKHEQPCFKRILVPLDGSVRAQQALRSVASFTDHDTRLVLIRILTDGNLNGDVVSPPNESSRRQREFALCSLGREFDALRLELGEPSVQVDVTYGDPIEQILHAVVEHRVDLIVMTSEGEGKNRHIGLGSTVRAVANRSPVPVFIVRNSAPGTRNVCPPIRRVVAPLDCSDRSARALKVAGNLAKQLMVPIALVTALDLASCGSAALAREAAYDQDLYRELFAEVEMDARRTLTRAGVELSQQGLAVTTQLRVGPVAETILSVTAPGDIVVMTSRGRGGGRQWPIGSVAEKLIERSPVPILLVPTTPEPEFVVSAVDDMSPRAPMHL
jgi:nucleotide-binding universal stress UspA family protein